MTISIGGLTLDESYAPLVNLNFEYFTTQGGEIIGGLRKYTVSGVVTAGGSGLTGSVVMSKLSAIRNLGSNPGCLNVNIPGFFSGQAKITNVNIEQGSDPSWINQGAFSIELIAPLENIPSNSFNLIAEDCVRDVSRSEKVEIGEDAHGYVYDLSGNKLSKTYVRFTNEIKLTCQPLCSSQSSSSTIDVLKKIVKIGPTSSAFTKYNSWQTLLQNRSLEMQTSGSVTFRCEIILIPPSMNANAFVDINFEDNKDYDILQPTRHIKKSTGLVSGLVSVSWSNLIDLPDTCSASKIGNAESSFSSIKSVLSDLNKWEGIDLELALLPNCPSISNPNCVPASSSANSCLLPVSSTISKSRTEGTISFDFEWSTKDCNSYLGQTVVEIDITEPQPTLAQFIIPGYGTHIQNLNCNTAKTISFVGSSSCQTSSGCSGNELATDAEDAVDDKITEYGIAEPQWLLIQNSKTRTTNSVSVTKKFIRKCL